MVEYFFNFVLDLPVYKLEGSGSRREPGLLRVRALISLELRMMVSCWDTSFHLCYLEDIGCDLLRHKKGPLPGHEVLAMVRIRGKIRGIYKDFVPKEQRPDLVRPNWNKIATVRYLLITCQDLLPNLFQLFGQVLDVFADRSRWGVCIILRQQHGNRHKRHSDELGYKRCQSRGGMHGTVVGELKQ